MIWKRVPTPREQEYVISGMSKTHDNIKFPDSQFIIMLKDNDTEKFHLHAD
jgi:hypothetical protein